MKRYYKEENGVRTWLGNVLKWNGLQIINPSEEQILAAGYVEYIIPEAPELTEEEITENIRQGKLLQLHSYDGSKEVNVCYIVHGEETFEYWADKHERDALKSALKDCMLMGRTTYRLDLRELGISLVVECELLLQMMAALEVYAVDCFNKTTDHEFALKSLMTKEEIMEYRYEGVGYPEKLTFNL